MKKIHIIRYCQPGSEEKPWQWYSDARNCAEDCGVEMIKLTVECTIVSAENYEYPDGTTL